jgi:hypothetical protein
LKLKLKENCRLSERHFNYSFTYHHTIDVDH